MYGNQDFSHEPSHNYDNRFQNQIPPIHSNMNYIPNSEMQMQQNFNYSSNTGAMSANMNFGNFNPLSHEVDNEESSLIAALEMRKNDEWMIENFLKENEHELLEEKKNNKDRASRISETRTTMITVCKLKNELDKMLAELKENRDIPESEWCKKINTIEMKRFEILKLLDKIENDEFINKVKINLEKRKKKRLREKRQRVSRKNEKLTNNEKRIQLHAKVDAWIKEKQNIIEKEKREVIMRKEADVILAEVRGKRSDAKKFSALLQELRNLRRIQVNIARARGEHLSAAADEAFTNIIDKLMEQWAAVDREYSLEEQGLKLMLKTDNEKKIEKQKKNIFDDWEHALFGRKLPAVDTFQRNINEFVAIRAAWDKYINYDGLGSRIPIGWVMPDPPSSAAWQKYLKKE